ncbi:MAG: RnfABCDGE type electron transport complex subunit D, partial [Chloroflexota bacterium]
LLLGSDRVQPLDFWWGPFDVWVAAAYAIILTGGILITRRLHLLTIAAAFWVSLAVGLGILAASGHCMTADWAFGGVCGTDFWRVIVTSPEVLIFLFFMITDPKTIPGGRVARIAFGISVGVLASLLIAPQTNEWWTKVMLLTALVVMCAARPVFERVMPRAGSEEDRTVPFLVGQPQPGRASIDLRRLGATLAIAGVLVVTVGAGIVLAGGPARLQPPAGGTVLLGDAIEVDPASLPPVTIDPDVSGWNVDRVRADAQGLALTLARLLAVEDQAMLSGDRALLEQVDHGDRLDEMTARLAQAQGIGQPTTIDYDFDSLFLTQRLLGRQSGMGMAFEATGTQTESTYDGAGSVVSRQESPFAQTFVIRQVFGDDRWFIVGVLPTE